MSISATANQRPRLNGSERRLLDGLFQALLQDAASQVTKAFLERAAGKACANRRAAAGALMPMLAAVVGPSERYLTDLLSAAGLARRQAELVRLAARLVVETYGANRPGAQESADALVRAIYSEAVSSFARAR